MHLWTILTAVLAVAAWCYRPISTSPASDSEIKELDESSVAKNALHIDTDLGESNQRQVDEDEYEYEDEDEDEDEGKISAETGNRTYTEWVRYVEQYENGGLEIKQKEKETSMGPLEHYKGLATVDPRRIKKVEDDIYRLSQTQQYSNVDLSMMKFKMLKEFMSDDALNEYFSFKWDISNSDGRPVKEEAIIDPMAKDYGVVLNCGSSGSRVVMYRWNSTLPFPKLLYYVYPIKKSDQSSKPVGISVKPGLSNFQTAEAAIEHIRPLVDYVANYIPKERHPHTRIFLLATAGMRLLSLDTQSDILEAIENFIKSMYNFKLVQTETISGAHEGQYMWVTLNYNRGYILNPARKFKENRIERATVFEMGGASLQVNYALTAKEWNKLDNKWRRQFGNWSRKYLLLRYTMASYLTELAISKAFGLEGKYHYKVFAVSYLGFGSASAREGYHDMLIHDHLKQTSKLSYKVQSSMKNILGKVMSPKEIKTDIRDKDGLIKNYNGSLAMSREQYYKDKQKSKETIAKNRDILARNFRAPMGLNMYKTQFSVKYLDKRDYSDATQDKDYWQDLIGLEGSDGEREETDTDTDMENKSENDIDVYLSSDPKHQSRKRQGVEAAEHMIRYNKLKVSDRQPIIIEDPCLPYGYNETIYREKDIYENRHGKTIGFKVPANPSAGEVFIMVGSGQPEEGTMNKPIVNMEALKYVLSEELKYLEGDDFKDILNKNRRQLEKYDLCRRNVWRFLKTAKDERLNCRSGDPCPMDLLNEDFLNHYLHEFAIADFYYTASNPMMEYGLRPGEFQRAQIYYRQKGWRRRSRKICNMALDEIKLRYPGAVKHDPTRHHQQCFKSVFIEAFLNYGLNVPDREELDDPVPPIVDENEPQAGDSAETGAERDGDKKSVAGERAKAAAGSATGSSEADRRKDRRRLRIKQKQQTKRKPWQVMMRVQSEYVEEAGEVDEDQEEVSRSHQKAQFVLIQQEIEDVELDWTMGAMVSKLAETEGDPLWLY